MVCIKYDNVQHNEHIKHWLELHGMSPSLADDVPKVGFIVSNEEQLVCAGFLRMCEGNYALLDSLISNPWQYPEARDKAIDLVVESLINEAKLLKLKKIVAHSKDLNTLVRSKKHGFIPLPHQLISLDLSKQ